MEEAEWPPSRHIPPPGARLPAKLPSGTALHAGLPGAHRGRLLIATGPPASFPPCLPSLLLQKYPLPPLRPVAVILRVCSFQKQFCPHQGRREGGHRDAAAPLLPAWRMSCPSVSTRPRGPRRGSLRAAGRRTGAHGANVQVHCAGCCPHSQEPGPCLPRAFVHTVTGPARGQASRGRRRGSWTGGLEAAQGRLGWIRRLGHHRDSALVDEPQARILVGPRQGQTTCG